MSSADGVEFSCRDLECLGVEERGHHVDATGVPYEDYAVGELRRVQVQVEYCSIGVDDEFGWWNNLVFHSAYVSCVYVLWYNARMASDCFCYHSISSAGKCNEDVGHLHFE